ncbi:hypothetical protein F0245_04240 [Vibrio chagasii]|uniref:Uncharacterized protein n=1 Tax=Vibrio chagasii TaxID=170679 RepID=A0A7Y4DQP5_9VIBR|nr:hypothetical protein [Vibrio chagasii]
MVRCQSWSFELELAKREKHWLLFFAFLSLKEQPTLVNKKSSTKLKRAREACYAKASVRHVVTWRSQRLVPDTESVRYWLF